MRTSGVPFAESARVPVVSVVVPIYNERENLPALRRRLTAALDSATRPGESGESGESCESGESWEVVLVDDGSRDGSDDLIRAFCEEDGRFVGIMLSRNFGHQPAVSAGLREACGRAVVTIDGDLQDPPEVIPDLVARWREGAKVVLAERTSRADAGAGSGLRGLGFRAFYPIFRWFNRHFCPDLPDAADAGIFGLIDRAVVDELNQLPERNRFLPGLRSWMGFSRASVPYARQDRAAGAPKQTLRRLVKYAVDGMVSFSNAPLRAAAWLGFVVSITAFLLATYYVVDFFVRGKELTGFTTIVVSVLLLGGVQLICVGVLGEYVGRIYDEVKQRPLYVVRERLGGSASTSCRSPRSATSCERVTGSGTTPESHLGVKSPRF